MAIIFHFIFKIPHNLQESKEHKKSSKSKHSHNKKHTKQHKKSVENTQKIQILQPDVNNLPYRCENCNQRQSYCYCQQCQHLYCQQCYQLMHAAALKDHTQIFDLKTIEQLNKQCIQHQTKYNKYCLTCQQFLCELCIQNHNQLHQIVTICQAQDILKQQLNQCLQAESSKRLGQLNQIYQQYLATIKVTQQDFEKYQSQIYSRQQSELNSLKKVNNEKLNEIQSFQTDLEDKLSDIKLLQQKQLEPQTIESLIMFIDKVKNIEQIDPKIYQIALNNYSPHLDWSQDQTNQKITLLSEQLNQLQIEHQKQIQDYQNELIEYEKLMTKYADTLGDKTMFCLWCGKSLNKKIINNKCQQNQLQFNTQSEKLGYLNKKVTQYNCQIDIKEAQESLGNQQHFWIE